MSGTETKEGTGSPDDNQVPSSTSSSSSSSSSSSPLPDAAHRFVVRALAANKLAAPSCPLAPALSLQDVMGGSSMNGNTASMLIFAMYQAFFVLTGVDFGVTIPYRVAIKDHKDQDKLSELSAIEAKTNVQAPLTAQLCLQLKGMIAPAEAYLVELVAASQVKPLRIRNVSSYFKSCQIDVDGDPFMKHLAYFSALCPRVVDDPALRAKVLTDKWLRYHTTYASSPYLCKRVVNALMAVDRKVAARFFSSSAVREIDEAVANPWDKKRASGISEESLCVTYWFLSAVGQLPDNWFQGQKARDAMPPFATERMRTFFVQLAKISSVKSSMEAAQNAEDLLTAFNRA